MQSSGCKNYRIYATHATVKGKWNVQHAVEVGKNQMIELNKIYMGDALTIMKTWPDSFVQTVVTSPPYWGLRDYGAPRQIGLEATPDIYVAKMVEVFREVRRVLKDDGTLWLNLGDSYVAGTRN